MIALLFHLAAGAVVFGYLLGLWAAGRPGDGPPWTAILFAPLIWPAIALWALLAIAAAYWSSRR